MSTRHLAAAANTVVTLAFGLRPLYVLIVLAWWRWARRDLQSHSPAHPDMGEIVQAINLYEHEGEACRAAIYRLPIVITIRAIARRVWRWL